MHRNTNMKPAIELLCTLGPASMNPRIIERLTEAGTSLFRINLSHTRIDRLSTAIEFVQRYTDVPICLDSEGAQIRTAGLEDGACALKEGSLVCVPHTPTSGNSRALNLYPPGIAHALEIGDLVSIDFHAALVQVVEKSDAGLIARVLCGGSVGSNKAVSLHREIEIPALTEKDRQAVVIGRSLGIRHFALSFAHDAETVRDMRSEIGTDCFLISKIECRKALANLEAIAGESDALLIDRGDLSREVAVEQIPRIQKEILRRSRWLGVKTYVATNLLESMISSPVPTRAEVNDVYTTICDGANGLVLAAESAIGAYPIQCANLVMKIAADAAHASPGHQPVATEDSSMLARPHGGNFRESPPIDDCEATVLPRIQLDAQARLDCRLILEGMYCPVRGFMGRSAVTSVIDALRLPSGELWSTPILLPISPEKAARLRVGERVRLTGTADETLAILQLSEIFKVPRRELTLDPLDAGRRQEPGPAGLLDPGVYYAAGSLRRIRGGETANHALEFTPAQARHAFGHKGWAQVAGLIIDKSESAHLAEIAAQAFENTNCDGLYVAITYDPSTLERDVRPEQIRDQAVMIESLGEHRTRVMLAYLPETGRNSLHRKRIFDAIRLKNLGCSHIVNQSNFRRCPQLLTAGEARVYANELIELDLIPVDVGTPVRRARVRSTESHRSQYVS